MGLITEPPRHDPTAEMQKGIKTNQEWDRFPLRQIENDPTAEMQKGIKTEKD